MSLEFSIQLDVSKIIHNFKKRMKSIFLNILVLVLALIAIPSCVKRTKFPNEPVVSYKSFNILDNQNAVFVFKFTDGDGDIGLKSEDTTGDFSRGSIYYYNLYMKYLYKNATGNFVPYTYFNTQTGQTDTVVLKFRTQFVESKTKDKALQGEIYVNLFGYRPTSSHKNFKYEFYFYDRAHNKSNVTGTDEIVTN
jgi:hypothetical protein